MGNFVSISGTGYTIGLNNSTKSIDILKIGNSEKLQKSRKYGDEFLS